MGFLEGIRVLDFSQGIAGPFLTKLLGDWGAEVLKVEQPGVGDAARRWGPNAAHAPDGLESSLLFLYLNTNKKSITLDLKSAQGRERLPGLVGWADVVVESFRPSTADALGITYEALKPLNESLIMASVTSFGRNGPKRDLEATEIVEYAESGLMYSIGAYDREPLVHGAPQAEYFAAINAANGIMEALLHRENTGAGQHVDVSITECLTMFLAVSELSHYAFAGGVTRRMTREPAGLMAMMECADGYIIPITSGGDFESLVKVLDAPELAEERFTDLTQRNRNGRELVEIVSSKVRSKGRFELFHAGQAEGFAFGLVQTPEDLANCPHLAARNFYIPLEQPGIGKVSLPGHSIRYSTIEPAPTRAAPSLGQDDGADLGLGAERPAPAPVLTPPANRVPGTGVLAGLRVIDSSAVWAMPLATTMLGDMGAEVIKVEGINRIDTRRADPFLDNEPTSEYFNRSGTFSTLNRGKKSVTINLSRPEGRELFKKLAAESDVIVENNRPGVMKRLGLDYPELIKVNPGLIMLSNSGYGQSGPWTRYGAIALGLEPTTGLSYLTGYKDGPPLRWNYLTDYPVGMMAVFAILGALRHKRLTGEGQWIDLCMYQVGVSLLGEKVLDFSVNGHMPARQGNRHDVFAPQGAYRCAGDDRWVAISVRDQSDWQRFCEAAGKPEWAADARFRDAAARRANHDALDDLITAWTSDRDGYQIASDLQNCGVPAAAVQTIREVFQDPQLRARGFWQWVGNEETSPVGAKPIPGTLWKMSATPNRIQSPPPTLGQHNHEVLIDLLGVAESELPALEAADVMGTRPSPDGPVQRVQPAADRIASGRWREHNPDFEEEIRRSLGV